MEKTKSKFDGVALILAIGIALGGYFIGNGIYDAFARRTVTVKGLAERDVVADMALWNIKFSRTGGDLTAVQNNIDSDTDAVKNFLTTAGFGADEIQNLRVTVRDRMTGYESNVNPNQKYVIETGVMVRSNNVALVDATSRKMGDLVRRGITITEDYSGPMYVFNGLNDIKIGMIEMATKNAAAAGEQFAADADAKLGKIQSASQGVFSIESRDPIDQWSNNEKQSINKKVRVVSTVTFYLK